MGKNSNYDYIVVGAGSAGCVVANRLTEDGTRSVLLLEAGPRDGSIIMRMPAALGLPLESTKYNWAYKSEPEPGLNGRISDQHRGRVLGGSSSINGMVFVRGNPLDYEGWAARGLPKWSYAHVLPYFKKMETFEKGGNEYRGATGPLHVHQCRAENPLYEAFLAAGQDFGLPLSTDQNGFQQEGVNRAQASVRNGVRESTAVAYLRPAEGRRNLAIVTGATVTRLIMDGSTIQGVEYEIGGVVKKAMAGKEVVLSAGAFDTPKILMLSGIGDTDTLKAHDIACRVHLPGVGRDLQDHVAVAIQYTTTKSVSPTKQLSKLGRPFVGLRWLLTKAGLGASNYFEVGAFFRGNDTVSYPNIEHEFLPMIGEFYRGEARVLDGFQYFTSVMRPKSRGRVSLRSADPKAAPKIEIGFLTEDADLNEMIEGVKKTREIIRQKSWDPLRGREVTPSADISSDKDLAAWIRQNAGTAYHPVATCRMGNDEMAVTDQDGCVHGVSGLRIADASLMPALTTGNTNAPTIMIGEKIADAILGRQLPPQNSSFYTGRH
ncbi:choline dehydrogenase (plasmid) [Rhizobium oryzihabitans]|uniref:Choline dehydrogenase n=2 Tax=Hyphomicrobiales TaxID=356 RepID=A0A7L5BR88_9HYPH|nr:MULTISPECIES: choline dehydrogenase [Rhizobiaceae]QIB41281.1 choline dehydrogenase [Rhizobium oryzihabitans]TAA50437.1 choline dehydrogenase [Shinella sp. JR1-6]